LVSSAVAEEINIEQKLDDYGMQTHIRWLALQLPKK
jgi:hypothetical protein